MSDSEQYYWPDRHTIRELGSHARQVTQVQVRPPYEAMSGAQEHLEHNGRFLTTLMFVTFAFTFYNTVMPALSKTKAPQMGLQVGSLSSSAHFHAKCASQPASFLLAQRKTKLASDE